LGDRDDRQGSHSFSAGSPIHHPTRGRGPI
jgi:hypothetical protein